MKWHKKVALAIGVSLLLLLGCFSPAQADPSLTVVTDDATNITPASATLNGNLTDIGGGSPVQVSFQWGTTTAYGNETDYQNMTANGTFSADISGLIADTTYHFRAKAVDNSTTVYGADRALSYLNLTGWGWCPDYRGIADTTLSGGATITPRAEAPEVSDIHFSGNFTFIVPSQTDTLAVSLNGTKVRSLFYLSGGLSGFWLEESDPDYISCSGQINRAPGAVVTAVKPYWFFVKTEGVAVPERSQGGYVENLEFIFSRVTRYIDQVTEQLFTQSSFKENLELVLAKGVELFKGVRNLITPYIP